MTIVDVRLSRIALRKKVTKPTCNMIRVLSITSKFKMYNKLKRKPAIEYQNKQAFNTNQKISDSYDYDSCERFFMW